MDGDWDTPDLDAVLALGLANLVDRARGRSLAAQRRSTARWHALRDNTPARQQAQHRGPLRPRQRLLPAVARRDDDVLLGAVRREHGDDLARRAACASGTTCSTCCSPRAKDRPARDRLRLGRLRDARRAARPAAASPASRSPRSSTRGRRSAVAEAGLEDRVDIRLQDYRARAARPTRRSPRSRCSRRSARRWWPVFFQRMRELLTPGGAAALQTITIDETTLRRLPPQARLHPALHLPRRHAAEPRALPRGRRAPRAWTSASRSFFGAELRRDARASGARASRRPFPHVRALGFDERFVRMWRYYLAYCRAGFSAGTIDVMQVRLEA